MLSSFILKCLCFIQSSPKQTLHVYDSAHLLPSSPNHTGTLGPLVGGFASLCLSFCIYKIIILPFGVAVKTLRSNTWKCLPRMGLSDGGGGDDGDGVGSGGGGGCKFRRLYCTAVSAALCVMGWGEGRLQIE